MNNFHNYLRHIHLVFSRIIKYAYKELVCILKGGSLTPSFTPDMIPAYFEDLKNGKKLQDLPMGAYEYHCCVEYLKKFRSQLFRSRKSFDEIKLSFFEIDENLIIISPLEDCLITVANEIGFDLIEENIDGIDYEYTFKSRFFQKL